MFFQTGRMTINDKMVSVNSAIAPVNTLTRSVFDNKQINDTIDSTNVVRP